jgi:hypothetical protein
VIGLGIVTLVFASLTSDLSVRARFSMSRQAFDVAARNALEGKSLRTPTRIGYFRVTEIDRAGKSVRFVIGEYGLADSIGVAYSPGGEPPVVGEDYYYDLGGPWWLWIRSW